MADEDVPNFGNLNEALEAAERDVLHEITADLVSDRESLVSAFQRVGIARQELGKAIAVYRAHFKADRTWIRITPVLLEWIDRTSRATLYNLIDDAERNQSLSAPRRAAMLRAKLNPLTRRNSAIVKRLAGGMEDESPQAADQAVQTAMKVPETKPAKIRRADPAGVPPQLTLEELSADQIVRVENFAKAHPEVEKTAIATAVISRLQIWAGLSVKKPRASAKAKKTERNKKPAQSSKDTGKSLKAVPTVGEQERKSPRPEPTLFDLVGEQEELA